jgi:hypothetical protein
MRHSLDCTRNIQIPPRPPSLYRPGNTVGESEMNWLYFAMTVFGVVTIVWVMTLRKRQWEWAGLVAGVGCLVTAGLNSAAPVRGIMDPNYAGYTFGLAHSDKGVGVTLVAGAIWLACVSAAFIAVTRTRGPALWWVAATCAALLLIIGWPTVSTVVTDPHSNSIELGEYLTIPGLVGSAILLGLVVAPFVVGLGWASRQARN